MCAAVMSFGSGSSLDWTSITKVERTAENRPAWLPSRVSAERMYFDRIPHRNEGHIEILVLLLGVVFIEFEGLLAMDGEEVGARILGFQWLGGLVEGRVEVYRRSDTLAGTAIKRTHHFRIELN